MILSPVQTDATLLDVTCCVPLHTLLHVVGCCRVLLRKVWNRSHFSTNNSQDLFCQSVVQQCWFRLHSSSNIFGATHAHYAWFTKTYRLYSSHDALQVPTLLGVVASVCTTANTHAITPNIVGATMLGVVASVRTQPYAVLLTDKILKEQNTNKNKLFCVWKLLA